MKPDLLGYLLGALEGPEHEATTKQLTDNESLRMELLEVESRLLPMEAERWQYEPPAGLAARTCQMVLDFEEHRKVTPRSAATGMTRETDSRVHSKVGMSARPEAGYRQANWSSSDFMVTAGVLLATCMLFFPAVANSRHQARTAYCQNNMRLFGVALPSWADRFSGNLPYIPTEGNTAVAGFYAPQLHDTGYMTEPNQVLCPSSSLAKRRLTFVVPSIDAIRRAEGEELVRLQRQMGGSYCYVLGHYKNGRHQATNMKGRSYFAVMSDQVQSVGQGTFQNAHGGRGVVVLFEDGHARMIVLSPKQPTAPSALPEPIQPWDQLFVSNRGLIEAGEDEEDIVLGASWVRPTRQVAKLQPCAGP